MHGEGIFNQGTLLRAYMIVVAHLCSVSSSLGNKGADGDQLRPPEPIPRNCGDTPTLIFTYIRMPARCTSLFIVLVELGTRCQAQKFENIPQTGGRHRTAAPAKHAANAARGKSSVMAVDLNVPTAITADAAVYTLKMRDGSPDHQRPVFRISRRLWRPCCNT